MCGSFSKHWAVFLILIYVNVVGCLFDVCLHLQALSWKQERLFGSVSKHINLRGRQC